MRKGCKLVEEAGDRYNVVPKVINNILGEKQKQKMKELEEYVE